jgi:hypothetical protein
MEKDSFIFPTIFAQILQYFFSSDITAFWIYDLVVE